MSALEDFWNKNREDVLKALRVQSRCIEKCKAETICRGGRCQRQKEIYKRIDDAVVSAEQGRAQTQVPTGRIKKSIKELADAAYSAANGRAGEAEKVRRRLRAFPPAAVPFISQGIFRNRPLPDPDNLDNAAFREIAARGIRGGDPFGTRQSRLYMEPQNIKRGVIKDQVVADLAAALVQLALDYIPPEDAKKVWPVIPGYEALGTGWPSIRATSTAIAEILLVIDKEPPEAYRHQVRDFYKQANNIFSK